MRVHVLNDRCQGHALCNTTAPTLFHLRDDDGHAFVTETEVPEGSEDLVQRAAIGCPEQAIEIEE